VRTQYRVRWKREENRPKARGAASLREAERFLGLLTSDEPWRFLRNTYHAHWEGPDSYYCCDGGACGCGGLTVRKHCEKAREGLPKIEWARIESRQVTSYAPLSEGHATGSVGNKPEA